MGAPKGHPPYPGCEKGGRPVEWTQERIDAETEALLKWVDAPKSYWFLHHCCERKIPRPVFSLLAKKCKKFRDAYLLARQKQEAIVSEGCLTKKLDGFFGWRFLSANYKWKEETDTSGLDEQEETPGSRSLANIKEVCIDHADTVQQTSDQSSSEQCTI